MDYRLPDVDRLQVLKTLREMYPYIPVIFISGYLTEDVKEKAHSFDYGAYYVLAKPVDPDVLMRCVHVCLEEGGRAWANKILKQYKKHHPGPSVIREKELDHERRMAEIVNMVRKEPKKWMTSQLASRFGVTQRQIQEDIHELQERGIPIQRCVWRLFLEEDEKSAK